MEGIILAGGYSKRANTNKMLLLFNGKPLIYHAIQSMKPFVSHIIVVTGHYDQDIRNALKEEKDLTIIKNNHYEQGMFTSVKVGVSQVSSDFFILPGDGPFISEKTYIALLNGQKNIRIPSYNGHFGHPIFISYSLKNELLLRSDNDNLKSFRNEHDYEIINVDDQQVLTDIDTVNDFDKCVELIRKDCL